MTLSSAQYTLGTATATKIVAPSATIQEIIVHCETKQGNPLIYVGGPTVTSTTGLHVDAADTITLRLPAGEDLYAIGSDVVVVGVLRIPA